MIRRYFDGAASQLGLVPAGSASAGSYVSPLPLPGQHIPRGSTSLGHPSAQLSRTATLPSFDGTLRFFWRGHIHNYGNLGSNNYLQLFVAGDNADMTNNAWSVAVFEFGNGPQFGMVNGNLSAVSGSYSTGPNALYTPGQWYVCFVVKSGTNAVWYLAPVGGTLQFSNAFTVYNGTFSQMRIGNGPLFTQVRFVGEMVGFTWWETTSMSLAELQAETYQLRPKRRANLWCDLPMIDVPNAGLDVSGNGRNFTIGGTLKTYDSAPIDIVGRRRRQIRSASGGFTGTGSAGLAPFAAAAAGEVIFSGSASAGLAPFAAAATGTEVFDGSGSAGLAPFAAAATGEEIFTGSAAAALAAFAAAAAGSLSFEGAASCALAPFAASGTGAETFSGSATCGLAPFEASGTASETFSGSAIASLAAFEASGVGLVITPISGSGSADLAPFGASGSGTTLGLITGTGTVELAPFGAAGTGVEIFVGAATAELAPFGAAGTSALMYTGTGFAGLAPFGADAMGSVQNGAATRIYAGVFDSDILPDTLEMGDDGMSLFSDEVELDESALVEDDTEFEEWELVLA